MFSIWDFIIRFIPERLYGVPHLQVILHRKTLNVAMKWQRDLFGLFLCRTSSSVVAEPRLSPAKRESLWLITPSFTLKLCRFLLMGRGIQCLPPSLGVVFVAHTCSAVWWAACTMLHTKEARSSTAWLAGCPLMVCRRVTAFALTFSKPFRNRMASLWAESTIFLVCWSFWVIPYVIPSLSVRGGIHVLGSLSLMKMGSC